GFALFFGLFETTRKFGKRAVWKAYEWYHGDNGPPPLTTIDGGKRRRPLAVSVGQVSAVVLAGASAGAGYQLVAYPLDRLPHMVPEAFGSTRGRVDWRAAWRAVVAAPGGLRSLYAGIGAQLVRVAPPSAIGLLIFEVANSQLWDEDEGVNFSDATAAFTAAVDGLDDLPDLDLLDGWRFLEDDMGLVSLPRLRSLQFNPKKRSASAMLRTDDDENSDVERGSTEIDDLGFDINGGIFDTALSRPRGKRAAYHRKSCFEPTVLDDSRLRSPPISPNLLLTDAPLGDTPARLPLPPPPPPSPLSSPPLPPQHIPLHDAALPLLAPETLLTTAPFATLILSSRGLVLFATAARGLLTPHAARAAVGHCLERFCHPGDYVALMRELKACGGGEDAGPGAGAGSGSPSMSAVFRFRAPYGGGEDPRATVGGPEDAEADIGSGTSRGAYTWVAVTGRKHALSNGKRTKCFVLCARALPAPASFSRLGTLLDRPSAATPAPTAATELARMSPHGLLLHVFATLPHGAASSPPRSPPLAGALAAFGAAGAVSLTELVHPDDVDRLRELLARARESVAAAPAGGGGSSSVHVSAAGIRLLQRRGGCSVAATLTVTAWRDDPAFWLRVDAFDDGSSGWPLAEEPSLASSATPATASATAVDAAASSATAAATVPLLCEHTQLRLQNQRLAAALRTLEAAPPVQPQQQQLGPF
ncbi:hypothetical protein HK405_007225, partial [Cladochytrium tenue]